MSVNINTIAGLLFGGGGGNYSSFRLTPCGVSVASLQRCFAQIPSTETRYAELSIIAL